MFTETQTLKYVNRKDDIAVVARVIDLLGQKDVVRALELLMEYRNNLMESQHPVLAKYDPREERTV